ncbi:peptidoglycan DD-metalloendopeptidase family protein [Anaerobacterium chartisolvens]|nr:peptidoglycan DD-metalloendopeptidase family protein [Anaerobacterium chartisolvens]
MFSREMLRLKRLNLKRLNFKKLNRKKLLRISVVFLPLLAALVITASTRSYSVNIDNKYLGTVKSKRVVQDILKDIVKEAEVRHGTEISVSGEISYKSVFFTGRDRIEENELRGVLESNVALTAKAFAITADGKDITYLKEQASAEEVLNKIKEPYIQSQEDGPNVVFVENVGIVEREVSVDKLKDRQEAFDSLTIESNDKKEYTVEKGDIVGRIAERFGITAQEIQKVNPGIDIDNISIGQKLIIVAPKYAVNVKKSSYKTLEEKIPYGVEYEDSQELYRGESRVKAKGADGKKLVKTELVSINGILEKTNIISEDVLEEPKTEVMLRGTKERPRTAATGVFARPNRGSVSSRFGQRWRGKHTGIDIAAPRGTPNKAADGGVVTFAGWEGNYGKLIIIDHGNGFTTYYAHNDTIKVKKGQRVAKGDVIGTVGSTGNATGPHLHFEVRKNGNPVDPSKYI